MLRYKGEMSLLHIIWGFRLTSSWCLWDRGHLSSTPFQSQPILVQKLTSCDIFDTNYIDTSVLYTGFNCFAWFYTRMLKSMMQSFRVRCTSCRPPAHRRRSSWGLSCSPPPSPTCPGPSGNPALLQTFPRSWRQVRSFSAAPLVCHTSRRWSRRRLGRNYEWAHRRRGRLPKTLWSRSR